MTIPVNEPIISDKAKQYVNQALDSGWISSMGPFIDEFEKKFAEYLGVSFATTVSNGTTALHMALAALGIKKGDEVIVPDQTIISCPLAVIYQQATPVLVDVDPVTGNIDPQKIEAAITSRTKAIMVVHLFGHPADMEPIINIAKKHHLLIIEDAAEAHGAEYKGKKVGSLGDIATFSFYANKILTTGEGGMVVTNNKQYHETVSTLKNLAHVPGRRFFHEQIGYNYRLTNLQAALGLAHLEEIDTYINKKKHMVQRYEKVLRSCRYLELPREQAYATNVFWMYNVMVSKDSPLSRDEIMEALRKKGIDTRTYFYPLHIQPVLQPYLNQKNLQCPVSKDLSDRGFYLPSGLAMTDQQIEAVGSAINSIFSKT